MSPHDEPVQRSMTPTVSEELMAQPTETQKVVLVQLTPVMKSSAPPAVTLGDATTLQCGALASAGE
jgi:hypothetical protein